MTDDLPALDPNSPIAQFVMGLAAMLNQADDLDPGAIRAGVVALIAAFPAPPTQLGMTPQQQAEALIAAIEHEADEDIEVGEIALQALRLWPDLTDAYALLGYEMMDEPALAMLIFTAGMMVAEEGLAPGALEQDDIAIKELVGGPEFLRALDALSRATLAVGDVEAAGALFAQLLELDPEDEQEVRYPLMSIALTLGISDVAGDILSAFPDDDAPELLYAAALLGFQREGDSDEANTLLARARERNRHVPGYLVGTTSVPEIDELPSEGSTEEGALCALALADAWKATPGAIEWVRRGPSGPTLLRTPTKEKRTGPRLIE